MLEQALDLSPNNSELIETVGELHLQSGDRVKAKATWQRLLRAEIEETEARQRLMSIYADNAMLDEAIMEGNRIWELSSKKIASGENQQVQEIVAVEVALELAELTEANNDLSASLSWFERASMVSNDWSPTMLVAERWQHFASELSEPSKAVAILHDKLKTILTQRSDRPTFASGFLLCTVRAVDPSATMGRSWGGADRIAKAGVQVE